MSEPSPGGYTHTVSHKDQGALRGSRNITCIPGMCGTQTVSLISELIDAVFSDGLSLRMKVEVLHGNCHESMCGQTESRSSGRVRLEHTAEGWAFISDPVLQRGTSKCAGHQNKSHLGDRPDGFLTSEFSKLDGVIRAYT